MSLFDNALSATKRSNSASEIVSSSSESVSSSFEDVLSAAKIGMPATSTDTPTKMNNSTAINFKCFIVLYPLAVLAS